MAKKKKTPSNPQYSIGDRLQVGNEKAWISDATWDGYTWQYTISMRQSWSNASGEPLKMTPISESQLSAAYTKEEQQ